MKKNYKLLALAAAMLLALSFLSAFAETEMELPVPPEEAGAENATWSEAELWTEDMARAVSAPETAEIPNDEPKASYIAINAKSFPDKEFRSYVLKNLDDGDKKLTADERARVYWLDLGAGGESLDDTIECPNIRSFKGIEYFTELVILNIGQIKLTDHTLDLSKNLKLEQLNCFECDLQTLKLGKNTSLTRLNCRSNPLTSLDVSKCTGLNTLDCSDCKLTQLKLGKMKNLEYLFCGDNELVSLDVSGCTGLSTLSCSNNPLKKLDVTRNSRLFQFHCDNCGLTSLNVTKNTYLGDLSCANNKIKTLKLTKLKDLYNLECQHNALTALDVSKASHLSQLECGYNAITQLDLSKNPELEQLHCGHNSLKKLDVTKLTKLYYLDCGSNSLKKLNVARNTELQVLNCSGNKLKTLNIAKCPVLKKAVASYKRKSADKGTVAYWGHKVKSDTWDWHVVVGKYSYDKLLAVDTAVEVTDGKTVLYKG